MKCTTAKILTRSIAGPKDGLTMPKPMQTIQSRKNEMLFLAAFMTDTINTISAVPEARSRLFHLVQEEVLQSRARHLCSDSCNSPKSQTFR